MGSLTSRAVQAERMDQPGLPARDHVEALSGLARIHTVTKSTRALWPSLRELAKAKDERPLRVLDVACGGGTVTLALARRGRKAGLALDIAGCDRSARALEFARDRATIAGISSQFFELDVLSNTIPEEYDVILSTLFLHHLGDRQARSFLNRCAEAAKRAVLIEDLARSGVAYAFTWLGVRLLTRSHVVHADGPMSVRAAFTLAEARRLAAAAGMEGATVHRVFPFRYLLHWRKT